MSVGDILDRGLKLLFARLPAYYGINLLVLSPLILIQLALPYLLTSVPGDPLAGFGAVMGASFFALLLYLVLQPIATAAILHIVMQEYLNKRATVGEAFAFAMTRFLSLLGTSILVVLILIVAFICFCIPFIYLGILYSVVAQVVVLEKLGGTSALSRSQQLIANYWWRAFGIIFLCLVGQAIVTKSLEMGLEAVLPSLQVIPAANGPRIEINGTNHIIGTFVTQLARILFSTFTAICTTLLYLDLRIRKEGFDLELATDSDGDYRRRDDDDDYRRDDDDYRRDRRDDPPEEARW
ncbi:MAG: hypothetical protein K8U57_20675 [Planctomycetes bacterium]|nr:hypothetical protein [Planctomycetota bacterium]